MGLCKEKRILSFVDEVGALACRQLFCDDEHPPFCLQTRLAIYID